MFTLNYEAFLRKCPLGVSVIKQVENWLFNIMLLSRRCRALQGIEYQNNRCLRLCKICSSLNYNLLRSKVLLMSQEEK